MEMLIWIEVKMSEDELQEYASSSSFDPLKDAYCMHCLLPFKEEEELGKCEQIDHLIAHAMYKTPSMRGCDE